MVLTAYFVLSPVTGLSCHRHPRSYLRQLDTSVGASGPYDFAVRARLRQRPLSRPSGEVSERRRPDALPKEVINEAELAIIAAKNESVCLLGDLVVHGLRELVRRHRTKRPECLLVLRRNEEAAGRDRQNDVRIFPDKTVGHDYRTVRSQQRGFGCSNRGCPPIQGRKHTNHAYAPYPLGPDA